jgi:CYTH domain-containing protein
MEIERKFVIQSVPEGVSSGRKIIQGYLWFDPEVRLRKIGGEHKLTIKPEGTLTREESEHDIPEELFRLLWPLVGSNIVRKTRHLLDYNDLVLEIDVYSGKHEGLITLECEFETVEEAERFELPDWIGPAVDVTYDSRYRNKELVSGNTIDLGLLK